MSRVNGLNPTTTRSMRKDHCRGILGPRTSLAGWCRILKSVDMYLPEKHHHGVIIGATPQAPVMLEWSRALAVRTYMNACDRQLRSTNSREEATNVRLCNPLRLDNTVH
eukprot:13456549-Alexandrium_andersonii.AAC.1